MLCLMFECEDRGVLATGGEPWTDEDIAAASGGDISEGLSCISELLRKGVAHRNNSGAIFSKRMVRDEQTRKERIKAGSTGGSRTQANRKQSVKQKQTPSSSSSSSNKNTPNGDGKPSDSDLSFWDVGESLLMKSGWTKKNAHSFIGGQIKRANNDEVVVAEAIAAASLKKPADPSTYIVKTIEGILAKNGKSPPVGQVTHCPDCNSNGMHEVMKEGKRGYAPCPNRSKNGHK